MGVNHTEVHGEHLSLAREVVGSTPTRVEKVGSSVKLPLCSKYASMVKARGAKTPRLIWLRWFKSNLASLLKSMSGCTQEG